jgi:hypothetical protein
MQEEVFEIHLQIIGEGEFSPLKTEFRNADIIANNRRKGNEGGHHRNVTAVASLQSSFLDFTSNYIYFLLEFYGQKTIRHRNGRWCHEDRSDAERSQWQCTG